MRIGIASEWIGEDVGGLERYSTSLIRALLRVGLEHEYRLFVTPRGAQRLECLSGARVRIHASRLRSRWYCLPVGVPLGVLRHPVDVLHATFAVVPWCPARRIVLTVHDVGPDAHPEFFPLGVRLRFRWLMERGIARASRVIVPTEATRMELLLHYPASEHKIVVVPEGADPELPPAGPAPEGDGLRRALARAEFLLYVGRFHARKNLKRLLEAFVLLRSRRGPELRLVLVGRDMWDRARILKTIEALGLGAAVLCPGHVSDATLAFLYGRARAFVFPSLHEGFGIPPLEAMAHGLPVLASSASAMPEVLGDAALFVDPYSVEEMAAGLERIAVDEALRRQLSVKGRERARLYTWDAAARGTLRAYEEALAQPPAAERA